MMGFDEVFAKFRTMLPEDVSEEVIRKIIDWCCERLEGLDETENFLLDAKTNITYGSSPHLFSSYGMKSYINVYQIDVFGIHWVFDSQTGENVAT